MTTSSATGLHPYDLLEAFALDALEPDEEQAVINHIDECPGCVSLVDDNLRTASVLAQAVPEMAPPEQLRARLLASIDPPQAALPSVSVSPRRPPRSWARVSAAISSRWGRMLMPATAAVALALIAFTVVLNVQIAGQMDDMQSENTQLRQQLDQNRATTTAQMSRSSVTVTQMQGSLQRLQQTNYALAQPGNQTLALNPAHPDVESQGVLLMSEDGTEGVLMVSGLMPPQPDSVYHVWLTQGGQRYWAGEMNVDERGWGAMQLRPSDSLTRYDSVQLSRGAGVAAAMAAPAGSAARARATASMVGDMVLSASLQ